MKRISILIWTLFLGCNVTLFAQTDEVRYDTLKERNSKISFTFPDTLNNVYLRQLRNEYDLNKLIENRKHDLDKVLSVLNWTHNQWEHNGSNEPSKSDALTILKEVKTGKKYRCVEYSIVLTSALLSLNYKARIVAVKTKNVETTEYGAGHVLSEVWIPEYKKWVLIDGQFNIMPILNSKPLNTIEFRKAIFNKADFKLIDINGEVSETRRKIYLSFIYDYLFYIDTRFDQRIVSTDKKNKIGGKTNLMLVPIGAKKPIIFQIKYPLDYMMYTNSTKDFYQNPN